MSVTLKKPTFLKKEPVKLSFGTSGLRALVEDMTDLECYINTKGFLEYLKGISDISPKDTICIAGDLRPSTGRIMATVAAAIKQSGFKVDNCGLIPTPAMAYYAMQNGRASIMVTGSHVPKNRNGIKYYKHDGEVLKADEEEIIAKVAGVRREEYAKNIDEILYDENGMFKVPIHAGPVNEEAKKAYIHRYLDVFPSDCFKGKTIIVYQHSAVGRDMLAYVLESLGSEVIPVKRSDEFIAMDTENITTQDRELFRLLADKYKQRNLFAIVSTDGDGDRPLITDEKGEAHRGDVLGIVACQYLSAKFAAVPISANDSLAIQLKKNKVKLRHTKIGSPYVIKAMQEAVAQGEFSVVGWEVNGGFLTGTDFSINDNTLKALPTRDAFLPILCALAQATKRDIAVSELFAELPCRYTDAGVLDNFPPDIGQKIIRHFSLPEENNIQRVSFEAGAMRVFNFADRSRILDSGNPIFKALLSNKRGLKHFFGSKLGFDDITHINYLDGIRITFANGDIVHIRPSGNAPQFRVYSNADSQERATEIVQLSIAEPDGIIQQMKKDLLRYF
jgi:phosphomannomutase